MQAHEHHVNLGAQMFQDYLSREAYEHWATCAQHKQHYSFRTTSHRNIINTLLNTTRKNTSIKKNIYVHSNIINTFPNIILEHVHSIFMTF
jgi:hypothetical protein